MIEYSKPLLLAALLVPGSVLAQINLGDTLGVSETAIRAALGGQGYVITAFEIEDDEIEVEAMLADQAYEFEISPVTGHVIAISLEEEDDDDEDDDDD